MQHTSAGGGFFSKIKENYSSKLAGLSLAGGPYVEKDGSSEDNTLIHNAFVKYYDSKGLPYPDWLGVKTFQSQQQQQQQGYVRTNSRSTSRAAISRATAARATTTTTAAAAARTPTRTTTIH